MLEGVPERTKVHFIVLVVLVLWTLRIIERPPVDVVIAGNRKPGTEQPIHDRFELPHLDEPFIAAVVAVDQVTDGHHEIWFDQIHIPNRIRQNINAFRRPSGTITKNGKDKGVFFTRQWQGNRTRPRREKT